MKYDKLLTEMTLNEEDVRIANQAHSKLDIAIMRHNTLMTEIVPKRNKLVSELNIVGSLKTEIGLSIKGLDSLVYSSQDTIDKLMVLI